MIDRIRGLFSVYVFIFMIWILPFKSQLFLGMTQLVNLLELVFHSTVEGSKYCHLMYQLIWYLAKLIHSLSSHGNIHHHHFLSIPLKILRQSWVYNFKQFKWQSYYAPFILKLALYLHNNITHVCDKRSVLFVWW